MRWWQDLIDIKLTLSAPQHEYSESGELRHRLVGPPLTHLHRPLFVRQLHFEDVELVSVCSVVNRYGVQVHRGYAARQVVHEPKRPQRVRVIVGPPAATLGAASESRLPGHNVTVKPKRRNSERNASTFSPKYKTACPCSGAETLSGCQNFTRPVGKHRADATSAMR